MADIVIFVPGSIWETWREAAIRGRWSWGQSAKPPPVRAGERVYVASQGRVQGFGILTGIEQKAEDPGHFGNRRVRWQIEVAPMVEQAGPPVVSLSTWRYAERVGVGTQIG